MKTLTPLRPVAEQVRDLSDAILAERERETAREGDTAWNCEKIALRDERIADLEAERDKSNNTRLAAETMMREARENLRLAYARVDELEAEREWKPWPPPDNAPGIIGPRMVIVTDHLQRMFLVDSRIRGHRARTWRYCEIPAYVPPRGDDHA
jgi:hypothetical protein